VLLPWPSTLETAAFTPRPDALLEIRRLLIDMDGEGLLKRGATHNFHVQPFEGGRLDPTSLSITGIDPFHPLRPALPERDALQRVFREIRHAVVPMAASCDPGWPQRRLRSGLPERRRRARPGEAQSVSSFSCFDTATLAGAALGQTRARQGGHGGRTGVGRSSAHNARYDAQRSADIFCLVCNRLRDSHQAAEERARELGRVERGGRARAEEPPPGGGGSAAVSR